MTKRQEKKSETIEVRVSYTEKLAFMEACKQAGTTASHAIRGYIDDVLHPDPADSFATKVKRVGPVGGLLVAALVLATVFVQTFERANSADTLLPTTERVFNFFDHNGDGTITHADIKADDPMSAETINWLIEYGDQGSDKALNREELAALTDFTIEMNASKGGLQRDKGAHTPDQQGENIMVFRPGMTLDERRAFLEKSGLATRLEAEELERLTRMLDAFMGENGPPQQASRPPGQ